MQLLLSHYEVIWLAIEILEPFIYKERKAVSSGVYVYIIHVEEDGASYTIKGDVTVL